MTIQEAYKKIKDSEDLKKKAIEAVKAGKGDEFLKENGFDLTVDQIKAALQEGKSGELTKEELNMAAGGCGDDPCGDVVFSLITVAVGCVVSFAVQEGSGSKISDC